MQIRIWGFLLLTLMPAAASAQAESSTPTLVVFGFLPDAQGDDDFMRRAGAAVHTEAQSYDDWAVRSGLPSYEYTAENLGCVEPYSSLDCWQRIAARSDAMLVIGSFERNSTRDDFGFLIHVDLISRDGTLIGSVAESTPGHELAEDQYRALARRIIRGLRRRAGLPVDETEPEPPPIIASMADAPSVRRGPDFLSPLGWSLLAGGLASFGGLIGVWVRINDLDHDPAFSAYREMTPQGVYLCGDGAPDHVRAVCREGSDLEIAQDALIIISLILGGGGLTTLILDAAGVGSVEVRPRAGLTSAGLDLHLTF